MIRRMLVLLVLLGTMVVAIPAQAEPAADSVIATPQPILHDSQLVFSNAIRKENEFDQLLTRIPALNPVVEFRLYNTRVPAREVLMYYAEYSSINPLTLLSILEMESGILSTRETEGKLQYAAGIKSSQLEGFDQQMEWLTSKLVEHYYGHKYDEPTEIPTIPNLNAGSFAVHSVLALANGEDALDPTKLPERGSRFMAIYRQFGDPLEDVWWKPPQGRGQAGAPRVGQQDNAIGILQTQPYMLLPWTDGESWHFTGGPHNYSGNCCSRPWSSLDYAPQGPAGCDWTSYSQVKAARRGTVVESSYALVKVDHQQEVWEEP